MRSGSPASPRRRSSGAVEIFDDDRGRQQTVERYGYGFGILFFDVDRFKEINDRFGHRVGDAVLRAVAATAAGAMRTSDSVGRWGGDEFIAICPAADAAGLRAAGERVRALVRSTGIPADGAG